MTSMNPAYNGADLFTIDERRRYSERWSRATVRRCDLAATSCTRATFEAAISGSEPVFRYFEQGLRSLNLYLRGPDPGTVKAPFRPANVSTRAENSNADAQGEHQHHVKTTSRFIAADSFLTAEMPRPRLSRSAFAA
jgi:hypothetical protein